MSTVSYTHLDVYKRQAIPTVIVGVLFYVLLKEKVIRPEDQGKAVDEGKTAEKEHISMGEIFGNRNLLLAFILCFCSIYGNFVIITWLPQFLQVERGFTGTSVGSVSYTHLDVYKRQSKCYLP